MAILLTSFHIILIFALAWGIWKKQRSLRKFFWPALLVKLMAGICLGLLYSYYYSVADTFDYFRDASKLASLALEDFSAYLDLLFFNTHLESLQLVFDQPRAVFLSKITSVFSILTHNNYWIIGAYLSLISFCGAWFLVQTINRYMPSVVLAAVAAFLFLPSVVFWSSGLLKESLALAALFYLSALFLKIWFNEKASVREWLLAAVSLFVLWQLKYYYAAVFMPVVCTSVLYKFFIRKGFQSSLPEVAVWLGILILPLVLISFAHPNFYPHRLLDVILTNHEAYREFSAPEDLVHFHNLRPTAISLLKNAPWALFSGLFRPLVWETSALIQLAPGVENTLVLLLFLAASIGFKKYFTSPHRVLILTLTVYVVMLCIFITFSAPNFGTLSRYRSGYISFFVFIILCNNPLVQYLERSFPRLVSH